jgi:hypothetical protein
MQAGSADTVAQICWPGWEKTCSEGELVVLANAKNRLEGQQIEPLGCLSGIVVCELWSSTYPLNVLIPVVEFCTPT